MKIEQRGAEITEIPYFSMIEVTHSTIDLITEDAGPMPYTLEEIEALRDALTEAIRIKREIDGTPANTAPRTWSASDVEPGPEITKVLDTDGDIWTRRNGMWWMPRRSDALSWNFITRHYSPLTDITNG